MSISTTKAAKSKSQLRGHRAALTFGTLLLPALVMVGAASQKRNAKCRLLMIFSALSLLVILASCGGVSSGGGGGGGGGSGNPVTYQVTIRGTSPDTPSDPGQSTVVTLVVD